jgi:molybdopterin-guanine dinucleotide biosynthesis protein
MSDSNVGSASTQEPVVQPDATNGKVSYETYQKVLNEAKKAKELARTLAEEKARSDEKTLAEQQQWKTLADQYKTQLEQTKSVLSEQEKSIVNGLKYQEFEKHLGGRLKNRDYATFIDFEKIAINPESKTVDEESVKSVVNEFLKSHSPLVEFQSGAKLPNTSGGGFDPNKRVNYNEMTSAQIEDELRKLGKI